MNIKVVRFLFLAAVIVMGFWGPTQASTPCPSLTCSDAIDECMMSSGDGYPRLYDIGTCTDANGVEREYRRMRCSYLNGSYYIDYCYFPF